MVKSNEQLQKGGGGETKCSLGGTCGTGFFSIKGTRSGLQERKLREGIACDGGGIGQNGGEGFRGD